MFKIGTAKRPDGSLIKNAKRSPGPGNYNTIDAAKSVRRKGPEFVIGTERRLETFAHNHSPDRVGPGSYEPKRVIGEEGQKATMSMKFEDHGLVHSKELPGPGQYDVSDAANYALKKIPAYGIGTSQRPQSRQ